MASKKTRKSSGRERPKTRCVAISYHLKCTETSNGLTHFVMYGDVPKKKMPL